MKCDKCLGFDHVAENCPFNKLKQKESKDWLLRAAVVLLAIDGILWLAANALLAVVAVRGK